MEPYQHEIRFAVVIYGGVSLAIYINGVAQELLRMVRATAPEPGSSTAAPAALSGVEQVYRKLASAVHRDGTIAASYEMVDGQERAVTDGQVRTRFMVDVLSGTSAGGINAIFLAKALANDQSLDQLARMWIEEADIDLLLNDRRSIEAPLRLQDPPKSLLNSQRMYLNLLATLDAMDQSSGQADTPRRELAPEVDLFTTTTDLDGVALPIELSDQMVLERRHRSVFHFQHPSLADPDERVPAVRGVTPQSDFSWDVNPFLAFAARCTSAFPFAFEPMSLCDIPDLVRTQERHRGQPYCGDEEAVEQYWQRFYRDYTRDPSGTLFQQRSFGDGGYLDNKPFSYAIETVIGRQSDLPVDRKLIYIEPSPEDPREQLVQRGGERPDAIENSLKALVTLPRYETIRQDLERVLEWNRNVLRMQRVLRRIRTIARETQQTRVNTSDLGYASYWRLRLSATVDRMADRVSSAYHQDPKSAVSAAIRILAGIWRRDTIDRNTTRGAESEQAFLDAYDDTYLARAIQYLRTRLDEANKPSEDRHRRELAVLRRQLEQASNSNLGLLRGFPPGSAADVVALSAVADPAAAPSIKWTDAERAPAQAGREARARRLYEQEGWKARIDELDAFFRTTLALQLLEIRDRLRAIADDYQGWGDFDLQDSVFFPMVFGTGLGEFDEIDIVRICPVDARARGVREFVPAKGSKLRGTLLGAFGAFLERSWRYNDMLWGRLDGAERLITSVLAGSQPEVKRLRDALIAEAHLAIAREWDDTFGAAIRRTDDGDTRRLPGKNLQPGKRSARS